MQTIKLCIVLVTFFSLVHATTKPSVIGWINHENERLEKSMAEIAEEDMKQLKNVLGKINQLLVEYETTNLSNRIAIKNQIVHAIVEANKLVEDFPIVVLMSKQVDIDLARADLDATLRSQLESLRAQFKILDQQLSAVKERVKTALKV